MLSEIITIGDEILIGQIVDTNSAWIAQKLNDAGIRVKQISSVSDNREHILTALKLAADRADLILITGGLGPTNDDITKNTLAEYFKVNLTQDQEALENVKRIFSAYNSPLLDVNIRQADVLENCLVLQNKNGTAPGMWMEHEGKIYVCMPGVPFEMMYIMEENVIPKLVSSFNLPSIVHHTILTSGIGESFLSQQIEDIEESLPANIKLAYLPRLGQVRLRLSAYGNSKEVLTNEIAVYSSKIIERISQYVIAELDVSLEKYVLDYMQSRNLTLSTAESCTGGYISHLITQHPGCSSVFLGGAVSYSYNLKKIMLGVNAQTLLDFGAVSGETVTEMALGAVKNYDSDYAIAVSGIAGPDGGLPDKPVGTVWIAIASRNRVISKKFQFSNKRTQNIERSAINALSMLIKFLKEDFA